MENANKLAIIIPVFNNWQFTKNLLVQLKNLPSNHKIFIVDNNSTDNTKALKSADNFSVIRNDRNMYFATACNQGFAQALSEGFSNVMFLNNDVKVSINLGDWTRPLIEAAEEGFIAGPTIGCLDNNYCFTCESSKFPSRGHWYMSGWNITTSVETWKKLVLPGEIGPFSTEFGFYFEDTDLGLRAHELGIKFNIVDVPVKHFGQATAKTLGTNELYSKASKIFLAKWRK